MKKFIWTMKSNREISPSEKSVCRIYGKQIGKTFARYINRQWYSLSYEKIDGSTIEYFIEL